MPLGSGPWQHAFELRYLLSEGALAPFGERESLKNKSAHLISVPDGFVLYANLVISPQGVPLNYPLPAELLPAGQPLWRTRLRDGRLALLMARILELDEQNRTHIQYVRKELKPTATFSGSAHGKRHMEVLTLNWSPDGGNAILVVPMGHEAFRPEREPSSSEESRSPRSFKYECPRSEIELLAPDGRTAISICLDECQTSFELTKGEPAIVAIGRLTAQLKPSNLTSGSSFFAAPSKFACRPTVNGGSPRTWEYTVGARFDGFTMTIDIRQMSVSLQRKNLAAPFSQLKDSEELLMMVPNETLKLLVTPDAPDTSIELLGRFTLRNRK